MVSSLRTSSLNQSSGGFVGKNVNSGLCRFPLSIRSNSVGTKIKQEDTKFELCKKTVKSINFKNIVNLIQRWLNLKSNFRVQCKYIINRRVITKKKKSKRISQTHGHILYNIPNLSKFVAGRDWFLIYMIKIIFAMIQYLFKEFLNCFTIKSTRSYSAWRQQS